MAIHAPDQAGTTSDPRGSANSAFDPDWVTRVPESAKRHPSHDPKAHKAPVTELVLGLYFRPIANWSAEAQDEFWEVFLKSRYPTRQRRPLSPITVAMVPGRTPPPLDIPIGVDEAAAVKQWFIRAEDDWLVQMQYDRLIVNWRKRERGQDYPGFATICMELRRLVTCIEGFLDSKAQGALLPFSLECTYVNTEPVGSVSHPSVAFDSVLAVGEVATQALVDWGIHDFTFGFGKFIESEAGLNVGVARIDCMGVEKNRDGQPTGERALQIVNTARRSFWGPPPPVDVALQDLGNLNLIARDTFFSVIKKEKLAEWGYAE